jgi:hypothetical protein
MINASSMLLVSRMLVSQTIPMKVLIGEPPEWGHCDA